MDSGQLVWEKVTTDCKVYITGGQEAWLFSQSPSKSAGTASLIFTWPNTYVSASLGTLEHVQNLKSNSSSMFDFLAQVLLVDIHNGFEGLFKSHQSSSGWLLALPPWPGVSHQDPSQAEAEYRVRC